jgi:hypothetical protein
MGFENRSGRQYYYRKERIGNRVVSRYIGTGEFAELLAESDRLCAMKRAHNFIKSLQEKNDLEETDRDLDELEANIKILVDSFLVGKGFYKTKSREWRFKND